MAVHTPTSTILNELLSKIPAERCTLHWLTGRLGERSFGIILLLLALLSLLPGVSGVMGVLLMIIAIQMILARPEPLLPHWIAFRHFKTTPLVRVVYRTAQILRYLEKFVHPRWLTPFEATKRITGSVVLLMGTILILPLPLSNILPAFVTILIAFAYLETDGMLLCCALISALLVFVSALTALWETMSAMGWVRSLL